MASPSIPKETDSVSLSRSELADLRKISDALESILWMCETRENDRTAESVHSLLKPWDSQLSVLVEKAESRFSKHGPKKEEG